MLKAEATRSRKQRHTLKQIYKDLKELGLEGAYDRGQRGKKDTLSGSIHQASEHQ